MSLSDRFATHVVQNQPQPLPAHNMTPLLWVKVAAGSLAVLANVACIVPVARRRHAASRQQLSEVIRHSRTIDRLSAWGIPAAAIAMLIAVFGGR